LIRERIKRINESDIDDCPLSLTIFLLVYPIEVSSSFSPVIHVKVHTLRPEDAPEGCLMLKDHESHDDDPVHVSFSSSDGH
jgi:hypothetical protein